MIFKNFLIDFNPLWLCVTGVWDFKFDVFVSFSRQNNERAMDEVTENFSRAFPVGPCKLHLFVLF